MQTLFYFAYGSNLHPLRLTKRIASANLLEKVELARYCLKFHKRGDDGSSKCNIVKTDDVRDIVHGAIYAISAEHKTDLDEYEGEGYFDHPIRIQGQNALYHCFAYIAEETHIDEDMQPYQWYKDLVVEGSRYLKFPDIYISSIVEIGSTQDLNLSRRSKHEQLLQQINEFADYWPG